MDLEGVVEQAEREISGDDPGRFLPSGGRPRCISGPRIFCPSAGFLHDDPDLAFDYLTDLCGVDNYPTGTAFSGRLSPMRDEDQEFGYA